MRPFDRLCPWLGETLGRLEQAALAGRLGHGWLIGGPRGIGKANLAYVLADRLLAGEAGGEPPAAAGPGEIVAAYAALEEGMDLHPDLHRVRAEEGKRSIAVEQIREMTAALALTPHRAGRKIVIMERADTMTTEAANALLKSLEEPTANTYLLLLAERPGRLPATIRSRCQQLGLRAPDAEALAAWLEREGLSAAGLPGGAGQRAPISLAGLLKDEELNSQFLKLHNDIKRLSEGVNDPFSVAEEWQKGDTELALGCLIEHLQTRIRGRLVPGHSNPVTDSGQRLAENDAKPVPTTALFAGLRMAENLREQLGRGTNVELALKSLLLGLELPDATS